MRILITTGIFPPESGGPATYAPELAKRLTERGYDLKVITYSEEKQYDFDDAYPFELERIKRKGRLSNYWRFFRAVNAQIDEYDLVYTLDWTAAGFPVSLASRLHSTPYAVRVGGGYIWERYLDTKKPPMPLREFYKKEVYKTYPALFSMIKFVLASAKKVIFNTDIQPRFFKDPYDLKDEQLTTIYNPVPEPEVTASREEANNEIVFAGRLIEMKNVKSLVRACAKAETDKELVIIGDGPQRQEIKELIDELGISEQVQMHSGMKQEALFERIINAHVVVQPSWTDISPNLIFECLALDIPFLITEANYLPIRDQLPMMADPHSVDDIAAKLEALEDQSRYNEYCQALEDISFEHSWTHVTNAHESLFKEIA